MRARNIKPGFFENDELAELDFAGRLLFVGLWMIADREGRLEDRPKRIKASVFPYDDIEVESRLSELQEHGFIKRYEVNGKRYIQVLNFSKHQNPHRNEKQSEIPAMEEADKIQGIPMDNQGHTKDIPRYDQGHSLHRETRADSLNPDSLIPDTLNPDSPNHDSTTTTGNRACARVNEGNCEESDWQKVAEAYSNNIHPISGEIELGKLQDLYERFGTEWMIAGITEAVEGSKGPPCMRYLEAILRRWEIEGFKSDNRNRSPAELGNKSVYEEIMQGAMEMVGNG